MSSYTFTVNNSLINDFSGNFFEELKMEDRVPVVLHTDFWLEFIDAIKKEIALYIDNLRDISEVYTIDKMEADRLIEVSNLLLIPLDSNIDSSTEFLREEIRAIPFKISYKATSLLYLSFLTIVKKLGTLFTYFFNGDYLNRDSLNLLQDISIHNITTSLFQESTLNFSGTLIDEIHLDDGHSLDDNWNLDTLNSKLNTKHLALEYYCNEIITKDSIDYLMTDDYFNYLYKNMLWGKKGSEVPHIGCQVCCITDNSNDYYTLSDTGVQCVTTASYNPANNVTNLLYMEFGTEKIFSPVLPTDLDNKIARIDIHTEEQYDKDGWQGVIGEYQGQYINDILIATPDGSTDNYTYTLPNYPIQKQTLKITGIVNGIPFTLTKNGGGILSSAMAKGTINYETGYITLTSNFLVSDSDVFSTQGDGHTLTFTYTVAVEKRTNTTNTYVFKYKINNITYLAFDNGIGGITGTHINVGASSIVYGTGVVTIVFDLAPTDLTDIKIEWQWQQANFFDAGALIKAEYYTENTINLTEACVRDNNNNLVAYASFSPIQFLSKNYHTNIMFFIKKSNF